MRLSSEEKERAARISEYTKSHQMDLWMYTDCVWEKPLLDRDRLGY